MDTNSTPSLPSVIFETGHFGAVPHPPTAPLVSWAHEIRRRARILANDNDPQACWREGFACTKYSGLRSCPVLSTLEPSARYRHFEQQLQDAYDRNPRSFQTRRHKGPAEARTSDRRLHTRNRFSPNELDNDVALARSTVPLPGERNHRRCPSLERQEAFYDQSTTKAKVYVRRYTASEDAQVAELYHKGLLYNSGEDLKTAFDLNSIRHNEPTYIIRPAKRARKNAKHKRHDGGTYALEQPLHLSLSFSDIGDDEAIARYFFASQQASPEEMIQHASSQNSADSAPPPLRVIYELAGSQGSVDVDASQPPDLILDSEEFELLSDSEMQDTPHSTQQASDDPSSAAWVMVGDDL
ncbi:hypothetical protein IF1G_06509 [Cordyceps javanica]|uniref:Uncharacterized protein n=1 Tax=Cordyceps javanica TaxID=43265 RepID=A0A545UYH7_9HYPO|nr:hypothetical protein IF1G_06509 [Cordyceps javanica]TQW06366.1 hypothetical protein IF2G_05788 [Cordyceps javanica]